MREQNCAGRPQSGEVCLHFKLDSSEEQRMLTDINDKLEEPWRTFNYSEVKFLRDKLHDVLVKMETCNH